MKKHLFFLLLLTPLCLSQTLGQVNFSDVSLAEAQKLAAKQKKFIFIDVYTTWCGPCKKMAAEAFTDAEVSEEMNAFFINLQVDAESNGSSIASKYNVKAYPTTLVIDSTGAIVAENRGYGGVNAFLNQVERAINFLPKGNLYLAAKSKYPKYKTDLKYLTIFADLRRKIGMPNEALVDNLVKNAPQDSLQTIDYQQFIVFCANRVEGKTFDFILEHRNWALFEPTLKLLVQKNFNLAVNTKDKQLLKQVLKANAKILNDPSVSDERNAQLTLKFNEKTNNSKGYHESAVELLTKYYVPKLSANDDSLTTDYRSKVAQIGQYYSDNIKEKKHIKAIVELLNKACDKHECTEIVRVYAQILYRLNDVAKAKEWMNKALKLSGDNKEIADILDKMNKGIF